jgi:acyl-CoA synthetase (AMP-forming)/AMP-acid ligase II
VSRVGSVQPSKAAIQDPSGSFKTYEQISESFLSYEGSRRGEVALVLLDNSVAMITAYLEAMSAFTAVCILGADVDAGEVFDIAESLGCDSILCEGNLELHGMRWVPSKFGSAQIVEYRNQRDPHNSVGEAQLLLATSGSTGGKKWVRLSAGAVDANANGIAEMLNMSHDDHLAAILPLSYTYGLSVLHSSLVAGATFSVQRVEFLSKGAGLGHFPLTQIQGVPSSYEIYERVGLLDSPPESVRLFTQAGGRLSQEKVLGANTKLSKAGVRFSPMYGQTEATARMTIMPSSLTGTHPSKVGYPMPKSSISIGSESDPFEVVYKGPNVMLGYASSRADLLLGDTMAGTLHTGDLGFMEDGLLEITGRLKRIAKISGIRHSLDSIEVMANEVTKSAVVDDDGSIAIFYVGGVDAQAKILTRLKRVEILPRDVKFTEVAELPLLPSGKIDYQGLQGGLS